MDKKKERSEEKLDSLGFETSAGEPEKQDNQKQQLHTHKTIENDHFPTSLKTHPVFTGHIIDQDFPPPPSKTDIRD